MPYRNQHNCLLDENVTEIVDVVPYDTKFGTFQLVRGRNSAGKLVPRSIRIPGSIPVSQAQSICRARGGQFHPATPLNAKKQLLSEKRGLEVNLAKWKTVSKNDLPDSAFAIILPGGKEDETGRTVPRSLRVLPYKNVQGTIDNVHLSDALVRLNQVKCGAAIKRRALTKLIRIAKAVGIDVRDKSKFNLSDTLFYLEKLEVLEGM